LQLREEINEANLIDCCFFRTFTLCAPREERQVLRLYLAAHNKYMTPQQYLKSGLTFVSIVQKHIFRTYRQHAAAFLLQFRSLVPLPALLTIYGLYRLWEKGGWGKKKKRGEERFRIEKTQSAKKRWKSSRAAQEDFIFLVHCASGMMRTVVGT
jgi:hypothetical protein